MVQKKINFRIIFHNVKFLCTGLSALLMLFFVLTIFTKNCGGHYPQRVRGPFAHEEFYEKGELDKWEDVLNEKFRGKDGEMKNRLELMIDGEPIPDLEFGTPAPTPPPQAAEPPQAATNVPS